MNEITTLQTTDRIKLAADFVNSTSRHIFLTGKAGTGKTTFLKNLSQTTHKKHIIVAPTGIAALNAGGVTIHSQFLFPLGTYLHDVQSAPEFSSSVRVYDNRELTRKHPLNSLRKQIIRDIELLIIDEVSMLRADLLDAIDFRLRSARREHSRPFGGVQLLLIGDLLQLPPVVKKAEWSILQKQYPSPHFFYSKALNQDGYVYLELDKVFRQSDNQFIRLLNALRNNTCTDQDIDALNAHHQPGVEAGNGVITLTTHNYQADKINQNALEALKEKSFRYKAEIKGEFPESMFPIDEEMELKVGTQVMFIKNDPERRYFNGKLATVTKLDTDFIKVRMSGEENEMSVPQHIWENIKYSVNENKEIKEEVAGTFTHYPLKLAWAITVHKSQGLTFDRAIIDVGQAFAPGQVYVALSRLRSLDGLILRNKINNRVVSNDDVVVQYQESKSQQGDLSDILRNQQAIYLHNTLHRTFNLSSITNQLDYVQQKFSSKMEFEDEAMRKALPNLRLNLASEYENTQKFRSQITRLLQAANYDLLKERVEKASHYYLTYLFDLLYQLLLHSGEAGSFARSKTYVNALSEIDQLLMSKIAEVQKSLRLTTAILSGEEVRRSKQERDKRRAKRESFILKIEEHIQKNPPKGASKTGKRKKGKGKIQKGATYQETYNLVKEGLTLSQIAIKRSLAESTIEGHIAKGISTRKLSVNTFVEKEELETITQAFKENPKLLLSDVYAQFKGKYTYGKLRMVQAALKSENPDEEEE